MKSLRGWCLAAMICVCMNGICADTLRAPAPKSAAPNNGLMLHYADSALAVNPKDMLAWSLRISGYLAQDRTPEALKAFQDALAIDSNNVSLAQLARQVYEQEGKPEEGDRIYNRIMAANPDAASQQLVVEGATAFSFDNMAEALAALDKALELRPDDDGLWRAKGETLSELGRPAEALAALEKALKLNPQLPDISYDFACAHAALGESRKALDELRKAISEDPELKGLISDKDCFKSLLDDPDFQKLTK